MCGITGIFNLNGQSVAPPELRKMTQQIAHRGPDGEGYYIDTFIGLGHRRLAILDLSRAGHQPMQSFCKNYVISYNGELYNYQDLRKDLKRRGYQFYSNTDTEVVLNAWIEWGTDSLNKFNGMFAFAIWDKHNLELILARDRYGIKPLYYTFCGNTLIFSSEQKALLAYPEIDKRLDKEALLEYFTFQNTFTDKTLLKDIHLFPPASWSKISIGHTQTALNIKPYWDYSFQEPDIIKSEADYEQELDHLFQKAVQRQLVSDVDVGSYLSGGIDSGSITALAAKNLPYIKTFTCGFDLSSATGLELAFDERETAEYMSYLFKTEHYEVVLKGGDMERILEKLVFHMEEPRVGQSYPNFYISQLASKFVKVILSGTGGDELFAGYPWRYEQAAGSKNFDDFIDNYYSFWQRLIPNNLIKQVFSPIWNDVKHVDTKDIFRSVFSNNFSKPTCPADYINHSLYFEAKTFLHGLLLVEDKLSMANSLESRVPFLDNDLVDFAMNLPISMKLNKLQRNIKLDENEVGNKAKLNLNKSKDGKKVLRQVMSKYIPSSIVEREKQGFSAPDGSWFKGDSINFIKDMLFDNNAPIYNYLNPSIVQNLVTQHLNGQHNRRLLIWSLLYFNQWCKNNLSH